MGRYFNILVLVYFSVSGVEAKQFCKVASVLIAKGKVQETPIKGKPRLLKKGSCVQEGSKIKTFKRSFAKLLFIDKSTLNIGPKSEMKVKEFPKNDSGIINLIKGKIRAKVTKNYMEIDEKKSKLFIKTKTAAMGVRGTAFQVIYNEKTKVSSLAVIEGSVAYVKVGQRQNLLSRSSLDRMLNDQRRAVMVKTGEYSGSYPGQKKVTIPVRFSPLQHESLKKNFDENSETKSEKESKKDRKVVRSIVPKGLNSKIIANESNKAIETAISGGMGEGFAQDLADNIDSEKEDEGVKEVSGNAPPPEGIKTKNGFAPPSGGYITDNGYYVAPTSDKSTFDPNTNTYNPSPELGSVDLKTGEYVPPEGYRLSDTGVLVQIEGANREPSSIDSNNLGKSIDIDVTNTNIIEEKSTDYTPIGEPTSSTEQLGQELYQETFYNYNNQDLGTVRTRRSKVRFNISR